MTAERVSEAVMDHRAVPLCKMNLDMVSINAALRLDTLLDAEPLHRPAAKVPAGVAEAARSGGALSP